MAQAERGSAAKQERALVRPFLPLQTVCGRAMLRAAENGVPDPRRTCGLACDAFARFVSSTCCNAVGYLRPARSALRTMRSVPICVICVLARKAGGISLCQIARVCGLG